MIKGLLSLSPLLFTGDQSFTAINHLLPGLCDTWREALLDKVIVATDDIGALSTLTTYDEKERFLRHPAVGFVCESGYCDAYGSRAGTLLFYPEVLSHPCCTTMRKRPKGMRDPAVELSDGGCRRAWSAESLRGSAIIRVIVMRMLADLRVADGGSMTNEELDAQELYLSCQTCYPVTWGLEGNEAEERLFCGWRSMVRVSSCLFLPFVDGRSSVPPHL